MGSLERRSCPQEESHAWWPPTQESPGLGLGDGLRESNDLVGDGELGEKDPSSTLLQSGNCLTGRQTEIKSGAKNVSWEP